MAIAISVKDKRLKALDKVPAMTANADLSIKGLRPVDAATIRDIVSVLRAADNLSSAGTAHKEWRLHRYEGSKVRWSIDVAGSTRLLFDYDGKANSITGMVFDDPHA